MKNNKNNSDNVPQKSNNNKILYGGIACVALLLLGICWYMFGNTTTNKKEDNTKELRREEIIAEVNELIKHDFYSSAFYRAYENYSGSSANNKKKHKLELEGLLSKKKTDDIKKAYEEVSEDIYNCKNQMISMISDQKIDKIQESLRKFLKNYKNTKVVRLNKKINRNECFVKEIVEEALEDLEDAKNDKLAQDRQGWLLDAKERLERCTEINFKRGVIPRTFDPIDPLIQETDGDAYNVVTNIIEDIFAISEIIPDQGSMEKKYDPESLAQALKTWKEQYQTIVDDMGVAMALGLVSQRG